jgi:hypothetical protein
MKVIWKYRVPVEPQFRLDMPTHRKLLSFGPQDDRPVLWVLVDPDTPRESVGFRLYGTGMPLGYFGKYIGTSAMPFSGLVWHLFED